MLISATLAQGLARSTSTVARPWCDDIFTAEIARDELIVLIKESGLWREPGPLQREEREPATLALSLEHHRDG